MKVRALDADGDWTFGKGGNNYLRDKAAVNQNIRTRVLSVLNDCFFDLGAGIDWFNLLGGKNPLYLNLAIKTTILNTDKVTGLREQSVVIDGNRKFSPIYRVSTAYDQGNAASIPVLVQTSLLTDELGDLLTTESGDPIGV